MAFLQLFILLWRYAEADRWKIVVYYVLHAASCIALLLNPYIFAQILNALQSADDKILDRVGFLFLLWVGSFVWFNLTHRIAQYFVFSTSYRVKQNFINEKYRLATGQSLAWHSDNHSGSTISRINTAAGALHHFAVYQFSYINYFMLFWGPIVALSFLSWQVSLATLVIAIASIMVMWQFDKKMVVLYREMNDIDHKTSATFFDYVSNMRTIITLRLGATTQKSLAAQLEKGYKPFVRTESIINQWKWFSVSSFILLLEAGLVFYYIWTQVGATEAVLVGSVAAVFQYLRQITESFRQIASQYQQIISWKIDMDSVDFLSPEDTEGFNDEVVPSDWQGIEVEDLTFSYEPEASALKNVSFAFRRGEKIALVGESGSGKSSLMTLLRGLQSPDNVRLAVSGNSYNSLYPLSSISSLVPQDPEVFENTIEYNITFGLDYSVEQVETAIELACFKNTLEIMPNGLKTDVREKGVSLSGGEKQRLALARGILAADKSSIILLDEPTSSVDANNEVEIYDNLLSHFETATVFSSIHRLHLLEKFDRVIVLDKGKVVQDGSFATLRGQTGELQSMWQKYQTSAV